MRFQVSPENHRHSVPESISANSHTAVSLSCNQYIVSSSYQDMVLRLKDGKLNTPSKKSNPLNLF